MKFPRILLLCATCLCAGPATSYGQPGTAPQNATRLRFARGATTRITYGFLSKAQPNHYYLVKVRSGQRLSLLVTPRRASQGLVPMLLVTSPSGYSSGEKSNRFDSLSTQGGDYLIRVAVNMMASNSNSGGFRLKIWAR